MQDHACVRHEVDGFNTEIHGIECLTGMFGHQMCQQKELKTHNNWQCPPWIAADRGPLAILQISWGSSPDSVPLGVPASLAVHPPRAFVLEQPTTCHLSSDELIAFAPEPI